MAAKKYLTQGTTPGTLDETASIATSAGVGSEGEIPCLDGTGRLDSSFMPIGFGSDTISCLAKETLTDGMFVHFVDVAGTLKVEKAIASDTTKPANGFVIDGATADDPVTVYVMGLNTTVPIGSYTVADLGKEVCLSSTVAGACTFTVPTTTGMIVQGLGKIVSVGSTTVTIEFDQKNIVVRA